jgi:hypothetical protein
MAQAIEIIGGGYRNRTGLLGFAIRCIACLPTRLYGTRNSQPCDERQDHSTQFPASILKIVFRSLGLQN